MADIATGTGANDGAEALVGNVLADRYRVVRLLGSGGMGAVYLAEHVLMKKAVALKVLHPEMTALEEVRARFEREAVAAARIEHTNVATAMDCGRLADGSFYLVLEYVDGRSLRSLLDEGPLGTARAVVIARQIAAALVAAHAAGVVHRDLKPDNVMLAPHPEGHDSVKVLDFGIAKVLGTEDKKDSGRTLTRIGAVMGTPGYMAPEQAVGQSVDERADLYALGVVLYEMISGKPPFEGEEAAQILAKQLTLAPPPLPAGVPPALSALVIRLLEKTPADRPKTAADVAAELGMIAEGADGGGAPGSLPGSRRFGASPSLAIRDTALLDAAPAQSVITTTSGARRIAPWAVLGLVAIGAGAAWIGAGASSPDTAASADSASGASSGATPAPPTSAGGAAPAESASAVVVPAAKATAAGLAPAAGASSSTITQTKTTKSGGRTVTTTTKTTRRSSSERSTTPPAPAPQSPPPRKRRTGPGGIYIPPPSEWFK